jgi:RNA polymerase sigma factor (sigma-70 family)
MEVMHLARASDADLVAAARRGDRTAAARLVERHRPALLIACRHVVGEPALAEDAAQEALLQALTRLGELRDPDRFGAWLRGIGLNTCRYWLRQGARQRWSWEALREAGQLDQPDDARNDPASVVERLDDVAAVRDALAALSGGQRAAVVLCYLAGLPLARAAAILGVDTGAVKARLHKARRTLKEWLAPGVSAASAPAARRRHRTLVGRPLAHGAVAWGWRSPHVRHFRLEVDAEAVAEAIVGFLRTGGDRRGVVELCVAVPEAAAVLDAMLLDGVAERRHVVAYVRTVFGSGPSRGRRTSRFFRLEVDLEALTEAAHAFVVDPSAARYDRPVVAELHDVAPDVLPVLETMVVEGVADRRHVAAFVRAAVGQLLR